MTEEQQRIRGYLVAQAAKLTPAAIVEKIQAAMAELGAAAAAVPAARFGERPEPKEWSGNEVMAHVLAAHAYFGSGVLAAIDGRPLPPRPKDQGAEGAPLRTADAWLAMLTKERSAFFERVLSADANGHLDRTIEHPFFGPLNWRETLLFTRLHDLDHAEQLRKIAAALK
jgi:DinB family protein